jgi:hypothetical protein
MRVGFPGRVTSNVEPLVIETGAERPHPQLPGVLIAGSVMLLAVAAGTLMTNGRISMGLAIVVASAYLLLVSLDISLAIAAWVALLFFSQWDAFGRETTLIGILVVLAWLGAGGVRRRRLPVLRSHGGLIVAMVLFASWLVLSVAWASAPERALSATRDWWPAMLVFVVIATSLASSRDVVYVAVAFVVGSTAAVTAGFVGLADTLEPIAGQDSGRLQAAGDPNLQAATFLAAMFMAGGLMSVLRRRVARVGLALALVIISLGFFATQSRGGLLALGFALVATFVLFPQQRLQVMAFALIAAIGLAAWLPSRPEVLERLTNFGGGGGGRVDLWTVAWRIFEQDPLVGVGYGNFQALEPHFVLQPGTLTHVRLISETPSVVHNSYLQLLVETGIIGLALFGLVAFACMRSSWRAARRFDAIGSPDHANLARAVLLATIGMLAAMFFISSAYDFRLWVLFALGPVLSTLADRATATRRTRLA